MDIERELEILIDKNKGKQLRVGEIRLDWFAEDCLKEIRRLKSETARQSIKSEEVAEAIYQMNEALDTEYLESDGEWTCYNEFSTNAIHTAITALQAYQGWIPVSNVKPEKSGRYIAYVPEHWTDEGHKEGKVIIAYFRELNYEGKRRVWDDGAYAISGEVTHYKPLPEPPKGE